MNVPVFGTSATPYAEANTWSGSFGYRYQKSDRHFVGSEEQEHRAEEGSQVINRAHIADLALTYNYSNRTSVTASVPYFMAERSNPIRDADRVVVARTVTQARDIGDIIVMGRRWMRDPETHPDGNFSLGLGVKLPTGRANALDIRDVRDPDTGEFSVEIQPVDVSIQPGDGGWGFLLDGQWFQRLGDRYGAYLSGSYLFNPEEMNTSPRSATEFDNDPRFNSIPDAYILRFGGSMSPSKTGPISVSGGLRLEGNPAHDVFGGDEGRRRPGYAWSFEPTVSWVQGRHAVQLGVPIALYRNRTENVDDEIEGEGPGDAAFADYLILFGYSWLF